jgi:hypothetical protein
MASGLASLSAGADLAAPNSIRKSYGGLYFAGQLWAEGTMEQLKMIAHRRRSARTVRGCASERIRNSSDDDPAADPAVGNSGVAACGQPLTAPWRRGARWVSGEPAMAAEVMLPRWPLLIQLRRAAFTGGAESALAWGRGSLHQPSSIQSWYAAVRHFGRADRVAIDARDGQAIRWQQVSGAETATLGRAMREPVVHVHTDIARDGMLAGVNVEAAAALAWATAGTSPGMSSLADLAPPQAPCQQNRGDHRPGTLHRGDISSDAILAAAGDSQTPGHPASTTKRAGAASNTSTVGQVGQPVTRRSSPSCWPATITSMASSPTFFRIRGSPA